MSLTLGPNQQDLDRPTDPHDPNGIAHATANDDVLETAYDDARAVLDALLDAGDYGAQLQSPSDYTYYEIALRQKALNPLIPDEVVEAALDVLNAYNTWQAGNAVATKAARAAAKLAWANYVQDWKEAYRVGDSSGPPEFPDNGEIDYADD